MPDRTVADNTRIDAAELLSVGLSSDGTRLRLVLRDTGGGSVALSLPAGWVNAVVSSVPHNVDSGPVHRLESWSMAPSGDGQDLVLTLRTAEGRSVAFATRPWQIEGMATIASHSGVTGAVPKLRH